MFLHGGKGVESAETTGLAGLREQELDEECYGFDLILGEI